MTRFFMVFIFLFSTLFAEQESFPFLGVSISSHTVDLMPIAYEEPNKPENPESTNETTFGIQYGVQTQDFRTTFTAQGNSNFQSIDVEVDYIFLDNMFGTPKVRPYIGGTLGYIRYDENVTKTYNDNAIRKYAASHDGNTTTFKNRDGYYGLNTGLLFYVTDNLDADISFHYYFMDRIEPLDTMRGVTFALHYFY